MIIDGHTHYFKSFGGTMKGVAAKEFVKRIRSYGIDKAVVFTLDGFYGDYRAGNDELAQVTSLYSNVLYPWGTVDPRDGEKAIDEIGRCLDELDMTGFKFHNWLQAVSAVDPCMFPVLEEMERRRAPLMFHDGTPPYANTEQIGYLAGQYPGTTFILGHGGINDMGRQALRWAVKYDNILIGACGPRFDTLEKAVKVVGPERIVWGSDFPFGGEGNIPYQWAKVDALPISDDDKEKIMGGNMVRLVPSLAKTGLS